MNEQILKLLEQSGLQPYYPAQEQQIEQFAQLLVRECLTVINQPNGVGDDDVIRISNDVQQYFGVEE